MLCLLNISSRVRCTKFKIMLGYMGRLGCHGSKPQLVYHSSGTCGIYGSSIDKQTAQYKLLQWSCRACTAASYAADGLVAQNQSQQVW
jgi:hypothetical protein